MKRVRAILRLKMDAAAIDTADEQRRCRRIGRRLSSLRDADVMLLTLQKVLVDAGERLSSSRVGDLQSELESRRAALLAAGAFDSQVVGALRSDLAAVIRDVEARPVPRLSDTILIDAVRTSKRKGRAAYEKLGRRASDEALHRLRKRAKRELYQRDLLDGRVPLDLARQAGLDVLSAELGWHQDLVVLRAAATEHEALCPDLDVQLRRQIRNSRRRLRRQAARLYG
jgi:CHAD domain-containing protein